MLIIAFLIHILFLLVHIEVTRNVSSCATWHSELQLSAVSRCPVRRNNAQTINKLTFVSAALEFTFESVLISRFSIGTCESAGPCDSSDTQLGNRLD